MWMMLSISSSVAPSSIRSMRVVRTWSYMVPLFRCPSYVPSGAGVPQSRSGLTRVSSDEELAVFLQLLSVDGDRAALAQVADHVPVDGRVVRAAGLRVAGADREVERAADLLVEQHLLRAGRDAVV